MPEKLPEGARSRQRFTEIWLPRNPGNPRLSTEPLGGDMVSTWVAKPEVHAEVRVPRKTVRNPIVANDDNYALAA